jgi:very-short-patch-repair endonuclease
VLISRAKERCEVFSSILGDDIDLNRARSWGARALKSFLRYAQLGELDVATRVDRDFDSDFEREVASALQSLGYEVHPQVGLAGFFIDIAVVDPENPARYLLGIECDGATYHSSRSARDRDRLRQQVLEDRGWINHRVWSTDWFNQPQAQLRQVVSAIEDAKVRRTDRLVDPEDATVSLATYDADTFITRHEPPGASFSIEDLVATPYAETSFPVDTTRQIHELSAKIVSIER